MLTWKEIRWQTAMIAGIALLLCGCLDYETYSLDLDLGNKTGKMLYTGISSNAPTADKIEADFQGLIDTAYNDKPDPDGPIKTLSKELYSADNKLNARILFQVKEEAYPKGLEEIGLKMDDRGDFIMNLEADDEYVGGNGRFIQQDLNKMVKWPGKSEKIELRTKRVRPEDKKVTSLLPRWIQWKKAQGQSE